jgi:hypothetical protein
MLADRTSVAGICEEFCYANVKSCNVRPRCEVASKKIRGNVAGAPRIHNINDFLIPITSLSSCLNVGSSAFATAS